MLSFSTLLILIWAWADEIVIPEAAGGYEQFWLELNIQQTPNISCTASVKEKIWLQSLKIEIKLLKDLKFVLCSFPVGFC